MFDVPADYAEPEEWETWREELPAGELATFDHIRDRTKHALRGLVEDATADLVIEETLWQLKIRAQHRTLLALPGVGLLVRTNPIRALAGAMARWMRDKR